MRPQWLLLAATAVPSVGCSALVAGSGKNLGEIATRSEARAELGTPTASGETDGQPYEEFRSRRKIAEGWKGIYICMADVTTLGLAELILFPRELCVAGYRAVVGQDIRLVYDSAGNVTSIYYQGERFPAFHDPRRNFESAKSAGPPADEAGGQE